MIFINFRSSRHVDVFFYDPQSLENLKISLMKIVKTGKAKDMTPPFILSRRNGMVTDITHVLIIVSVAAAKSRQRRINRNPIIINLILMIIIIITRANPTSPLITGFPVLGVHLGFQW